MQLRIGCIVVIVAASIVSAIGDVLRCSQPPTIDFAVIKSLTSAELLVGMTVTYACDFGYIVSGRSRTSTCKVTEDGKTEWSDPEMSCIPQSCDDPGYASNSHRSGYLFTFPNSVSYECDEGFRLHGLSRRYCQTDGTWSGKVPSCEAVSCDPPENLKNGHVYYTSLEYGSELKFKCNKGYALQDLTRVYCTSDGTWSKTNVTCVEIECDIPPSPDHGSVEIRQADGSRPRAGTVAVYTCQGNRVPDGPTTSKCLTTREWTFPPPKCVEDCSVPAILNGNIKEQVLGPEKWSWSKFSFVRSLTYEIVGFGSIPSRKAELFLFCHKGYSIEGKGTTGAPIRCSAEGWSPKPDCLKRQEIRCPPIDPADKFNVVYSDDKKIHSTAYFSCKDNKQKITRGLNTITCLPSGEWSGYSPECEDVIGCYLLAQDVPPQLIIEPNKEFYSLGETADLSCASELELTTNVARVMCIGSNWSDELPGCQEKQRKQ